MAKAPLATNRGTCGPFSSAMIICSTSKPTSSDRSPSKSRNGAFMTMRKSMSLRLTLQIAAMPPRCNCSSRRKPSSTMPAWSCALAISAPRQQPARQRSGQAGGDDLACGHVGVVGHAHIGQPVADAIEQAVAGGGVVVAWLAYRAQHGDPAPLRQQPHLPAVYGNVTLRHRRCALVE